MDLYWHAKEMTSYNVDMVLEEVNPILNTVLDKLRQLDVKYYCLLDAI